MIASLSAAVTRSSLGLGALDLNDHLNYEVTTEIFGGQTSYERQVASSPYVDGSVTVHRRKNNVNDTFVVYVMGADQVEVQNNVKTLIDAFSQDVFNVTVLLDSAEYTYQCEASDYQIEWSHVHFHNRKVRVIFSLSRKPIATVGV